MDVINFKLEGLHSKFIRSKILEVRVYEVMLLHVT